MEKLNVILKNCYGIKKLEHNFDFSEYNTYVIYAGNGMMKSSFARTFKDLSNGESSKDLMFPDRATVRNIVDENNDSINKEQVFVMEPYKEDFESEKISTLLVKKELKEKYDKIHLDIDKKKEELLKKLKPLVASKIDIGEELSDTFKNDFFICLEILEKEILDGKVAEFADIVYGEIYNEKVIEFLKTEEFKEKLKEYIEKYDELIKSSTYFKKGVFNHNNAENVSESLEKDGFFKAKHSVLLNSVGGKKLEIVEQKEFKKIINEEKDKILNNPDLAARFNKIDKAIIKNEHLRKFRSYLDNNRKILPELLDLDGFRKKLWISYLKEEKDSYTELLKLYQSGKKDIEKIIKQAIEEKTDWEKVINTFNERFSVPFKLKIENQEDVILKNEVPSITFTFKDSIGETGVKKDDLLNVLSSGEKRALYILNIIFEVETRKKESQKTLFIIDDIADSFDYKNKYAIIEYLKEISEGENFYSIILTHNFDFFRTIESRFVGRKQCHMITKTEDKVDLIEAEYFKPFSYFKNQLSTNKKILIASVPFARNLIEYTKDSNDANWKKLTSILHIKSDSHSITVSDLESIFNNVFPNINLSLDDKSKKVQDLIFELAECCLTAPESINLENKIVLSIAIRLKAEDFMINKINDSPRVDSITKHQTLELFKIFKEKIGGEESIKILEQVNLMTPENIHLNSFMYEPILDLSDIHLKTLYSNVKGLT